MIRKFDRILCMPDVIKINPTVFKDDRGCFYEYYRQDDFRVFGLPDFVQENTSCSKRGVFRGLHYQLNPKAQAKLVSCVSGSIVDFIVDIRPSSPTYKKHLKINLFGEEMLFVPVGMAHGFVALEDNTKVCYKVSEYYSKEHERSINVKDPELNIDLCFEFPLIMSDKDSAASYLKDADNNF